MLREGYLVVAAAVNGQSFISTSREAEWVKVFVPKRFQEATFESYKTNTHNRRMFEVAKRWTDRYQRGQDLGLVLGGSIGTGKTHLMFSIGRGLARRGVWAIYKNFATLCIEMRNSWSNKESGIHLKQLVQEPEILLLDDLGAEMREKSDQGWVTELVYELIETRYNNMVPTIIATNLNMTDIAKRYTERVASRLAEMSMPLWVEGYDYRLTRRVG